MLRKLLPFFLILLLAAGATAQTIDEVIGEYTYQEETERGFESGFIRFSADHSFVFVRHLDSDRDSLTDQHQIVRGSYQVKKDELGIPGFYCQPQDAKSFFLDALRGDGNKFYAFCALDHCFTRKSETAPYFSRKSPEPTEVGKLQLITDPAGAVVFIDGRRIPGNTPLTIETISAGIPHRLRVEAQGYLPLSREIKLAAGQNKRLELALSSGKENVLIHSIPSVQVLINDEYKGWTPTKELDLPPGAYKVTLRNDGAGINKELTIEIIKDQIYEETFKFFGTISIDTEVPCRAFAGKVELGLTPIKEHLIPAGVHRLRLEPENGRSVTVNVRIRTDEHSSVAGPLKDLKITQPD